jgi:hypothetical protein
VSTRPGGEVGEHARLAEGEAPACLVAAQKRLELGLVGGLGVPHDAHLALEIVDAQPR